MLRTPRCESFWISTWKLFSTQTGTNSRLSQRTRTEHPCVDVNQNYFQNFSRVRFLSFSDVFERGQPETKTREETRNDCRNFIFSAVDDAKLVLPACFYGSCNSLFLKDKRTNPLPVNCSGSPADALKCYQPQKVMSLHFRISYKTYQSIANTEKLNISLSWPWPYRIPLFPRQQPKTRPQF